MHPQFLHKSCIPTWEGEIEAFRTKLIFHSFFNRQISTFSGGLFLPSLSLTLYTVNPLSQKPSFLEGKKRREIRKYSLFCLSTSGRSSSFEPAAPSDAFSMSIWNKEPQALHGWRWISLWAKGNNTYPGAWPRLVAFELYKRSASVLSSAEFCIVTEDMLEHKEKHQLMGWRRNFDNSHWLLKPVIDWQVWDVQCTHKWGHSAPIFRVMFDNVFPSAVLF